MATLRNQTHDTQLGSPRLAVFNGLSSFSEGNFVHRSVRVGQDHIDSFLATACYYQAVN